jgi:SsrA-binding protein
MAKAGSKKKGGEGSATIALNRKSRFDYTLEDRFEAGLALEGWEVKSLRAGKVQIRDAYVTLKDGEAFLFGAVIDPLLSASTHVVPEAQRTRKLLLHRHELARLIGAVERKGYTLVATAMYWKAGRAKLEIALAKGKKSHDNREADPERDWQRERGRIMKKAV